MKNTKTCLFLIGLLIFLANACQNNGSSTQETDPEDGNVAQAIKQDSAGQNETNVATTSFSYPGLDKLDRSQLTTVFSKPIEGEGDCSYVYTKYKDDQMSLLIDSTNCYGYGKSEYYYLFNKEEDLQMVHVKDLQSFYDEVEKEPLVILTEKVIDFQGKEAVMKIRVDTFARNFKGNTLQIDQNYTSDPWITVDRQNGSFVLGQQIEFSGDWYNIAKQRIKDKLITMDKLPAELPLSFGEDIGMGMRGEFRSIAREALDEVRPKLEEKIKDAFDHFSRMEKAFTTTKPNVDYESKAYWEKRIQQMKVN